MDLLQPVKGTRDLLFIESELFAHVGNLNKNIAGLYGYDEIHLPIFEYASVFERTLGEVSDVVHKQMYTFSDKGGRRLTLRPELTAGIARSVISNSLYSKLPLRLFSLGAVFRYENPQQGRYRQFNQASFECIGLRSPAVDAEVIAIGKSILDRLDIHDYVLELNSLGDLISRKLYTEALHAYLVKHEKELSEDSQARLQKNPMRILDSKSKVDQEILEGAPALRAYLTADSHSFFEELQKNLDMLNIKYVINDKIVRGLDYYTDTVFEFTTNRLGAQSALIAGGRYDGLFKIMNGKDAPAVGLGVGIDRLMALCEKIYSPAVRKTVFVVVLDERFGSYGLEVTQLLRGKGIACILEITKDSSKAIKRALESCAKLVIFVGENETRSKTVRLRNLETRTEQELPFTELTISLGQI